MKIRTLVVWLGLVTAGALQTKTGELERGEEVVPGLHSGLLFQPRGSLLLATGSWTAVVRFRHDRIRRQAETLRERFQEITKTLTELHTLQTKEAPKDTEEERRLIFLTNVLDIWHREKIWMETEVGAAEQDVQDLRVELKLSRRKRGLVPFLGDGLKWLFGTSTEKDTERIHKEVKKIDVKVGELHHIAKLQATLIGALTKEQTENKRNLRLLEENTAKLVGLQFRSEIIKRNIRKEIDMAQEITSAIRIASAAVMAFRHEVQKIVEAMAHTQQGKVTPTILHPRSLKNVLNDIKQHLPAGWVPAVSLSDTPAEIYNILDIVAIASNDGWEVHIQIPIKNEDYGDFFLYKVTPIPTHFVNSTVALQTEAPAEFFAISHDQRLHIDRSQEDVGQCKQTAGKTICNKLTPLIEESRNGCLYNAFRDNRAGADTDCARRIIRTTPQIYALSEKQWLYALPHEEMFAVQCSEQEQLGKGFRLQGTGVFSLPPGCAAIGDNYIVPAHLRGERKGQDFDFGNLTHFKMSLNLSALLARLPTTKSLDKTALRNIIENLPRSDGEEPKLAELKQRLEDFGQCSTEEDEESTSISRASLTIGTIGIVGLVVLTIFLCRKETSANTHVIQSPSPVALPSSPDPSNQIALTSLQIRMDGVEQMTRGVKDVMAKIQEMEGHIEDLKRKYAEITPLL